MKIRLNRLWITISTSLWFIPTLMTLGSIIIAFTLIKVDRHVDYKLLTIEWLIYGGSPSGARTLLSTIAGSMITIVGVVFSITLVALTLASSQFGPRLLQNFIKNKGNQIVLGTFVSTFIYSLIVLLAIRGLEETSFVPKISIAFVFVLVIASIGVLIFFIHHISVSIQADNVIRSAYSDLSESIYELMDDEPGKPALIEKKLIENFKESSPFCLPLFAPESGYVQAIDYDGMLRTAHSHNGIFELFCLPGDFLLEGALIGKAYHLAQDETNLIYKYGDNVILGSKRTPTQELEFGIMQIVEIAMRALSPGINDPNTAVICMHWLGAAIIEMSKRHFPGAVLTDEAGKLRMVRKVHTYETILNVAFDHLRLYTNKNPFVSLKLLSVFFEIKKAVKNEDLKLAINVLATKVNADNKNCIQESEDLVQLEKMYLDVIQVD